MLKQELLTSRPSAIGFDSFHRDLSAASFSNSPPRVLRDIISSPEWRARAATSVNEHSAALALSSMLLGLCEGIVQNCQKAQEKFDLRDAESEPKNNFYNSRHWLSLFYPTDLLRGAECSRLFREYISSQLRVHGLGVKCPLFATEHSAVVVHQTNERLAQRTAEWISAHMPTSAAVYSLVSG